MRGESLISFLLLHCSGLRIGEVTEPEVTEPMTSFVLPMNTKDDYKQDKELENIPNTYTNNILIVNGTIHTNDIKILKIRPSADNSTDNLTKYMNISEKNGSQTTLSCRHTIEKPIVRGEFQITIHAEYGEKKYWFEYYLDLSDIQ